MKDSARAEALKAFLTWAVLEGGDIAEELNYAPLPDELVAVVLDKLDTMR